MPVPLTFLLVFCGVIGFSRLLPEKAGASAPPGLSLIAVPSGEGNDRPPF
jgi:hypothetical protein